MGLTLLVRKTIDKVPTLLHRPALTPANPNQPQIHGNQVKSMRVSLFI